MRERVQCEIVEENGHHTKCVLHLDEIDAGRYFAHNNCEWTKLFVFLRGRIWILGDWLKISD